MSAEFKIKFWTFLGKIVLNFLLRTNRIKIIGNEHVESALSTRQPIMFCCWHGRLVYSSFGLSRVKKGFWAIAGRHNDAEIMGRVLESWGYRLIRGSSNKGSKDVLRRMHEVFTSDCPVVCITNDGPKGPANVAKPGSLSLARKYNAQLLMITGTSSAYWEFSSWDKFRLPKPFGKIQITISSPMEIPDNIEQGMGSPYLSDFMNKFQNDADECLKFSK
mgnify:CR=1 FL=1